jgi:hypothetical protein
MFRPTLELHDLDSGYPDWLNELRVLVDKLSNASLWQHAVPAIPLPRLHGRSYELRYICLISRKSAHAAVQLFHDIEPQSGGLASEFELFGRNVPDWNEPGEGAELNASEPSGPELESATGPSRHPSIGPAPTDVRSVVVDHYGLYVGSLYGWLERGASSALLGPAEASLLDRLRATPALDGPAVLLCPERIRTLHGLLRRRIPVSVSDRLALDSVTNRTYLKLTLLHELGHHVFPAQDISGMQYMPDAMANWFAFGFLDPRERRLLHAKTQTQSTPYRAYEGMLALLQPTRFGVPSGLLFPWSARDGEYLVSSFESQTFARKRWDEKFLKAIWPDPITWLRDLRATTARVVGGNTDLHSAQLHASILITESFPGIGRELVRVAYDLKRSGSTTLMPLIEGQYWSDRLAAEVRVGEPGALRLGSSSRGRKVAPPASVPASVTPDDDSTAARIEALGPAPDNSTNPEEFKRWLGKVLQTARV